MPDTAPTGAPASGPIPSAPTLTAKSTPAAGFRVNVPDTAGPEVIVTRHGQATTYEVKAGVITATTEDDAHVLASTIEGATLANEEK